MTLTIHDDIEQRSDEWFAVRRGIVTASTVGRLITTATDPLTVACPSCEAPVESPCVNLRSKDRAPIKGTHDGRVGKPFLTVADNLDSNRLTLILAAERIAGFTEETTMTSDMWRGVDAEPVARDLYSGHHDEATEVGFMVRTEDDWTLGYSPDGLVGDDGLIEVKAPRSHNHVAAVLADEVPDANMAQLQAGLLVSGRKWIDFIPFVGGLPLWTKRVYPDPAWQDGLIAACRRFETKVADLVADYQTKTEGLPVTERLDPYNVELTLT